MALQVLAVLLAVCAASACTGKLAVTVDDNAGPIVAPTGQPAVSPEHENTQQNVATASTETPEVPVEPSAPPLDATVPLPITNGLTPTTTNEPAKEASQSQTASAEPPVTDLPVEPAMAPARDAPSSSPLNPHQLQVASPHFSLATGVFPTAQTLRVLAQAEATTCVISDGREPQCADGGMACAVGVPAPEVIDVPATAVIKAISCRAGWADSLVAHVTLTIDQMASSLHSSVTSLDAMRRADGVATARIVVVLHNSADQALAGLTPGLAASGGGNEIDACSVTDADGNASCSLRSNLPGVKSLSLTSPLALAGGAVTFFGPPVVASPDWSNGFAIASLATGARSATSTYGTDPTGGTCVSFDNGKASCWGGNPNGTLGSGDTADIAAEDATAIDGLTGVLQLAKGGTTTCALLGDGTVKCWGSRSATINGAGSLATDQLTPPSAAIVFHSSAVGAPVRKAIRIAISSASDNDAQACALLETGELSCWGYLASPVGGGTSITAPAVMDFGTGRTVSSFTVGTNFFCAVTDDHRVRCFGRNNVGQMGLGATTPFFQATPVTIVANGQDLLARSVTAGYDHVCAISTSEAVYCWGGNSNGQVGIGTTTTSVTIPSLVTLNAGNHILQDLYAGVYETCATYAGGAFECWGAGANGIHGTGLAVRKAAPAGDIRALVDGHEIIAFAISSHACALLDDRSLHCWGANLHGETTHPIMGPYQRQSLALSRPLHFANTTGLKAIHGSWENACAHFNDGGLECWGFNVSGVPKQEILPEGTAADTVYAAGTCFVTSDGHHYCKGYNDQGIFGVGNAVSTVDWVPVPDLDAESANIQSIYSSSYVSCAIMTNGRLRCWGKGMTNRWGDGTTTERLAPPSTDLPLYDSYGNYAFVRKVQSQASWMCAMYDSPTGQSNPDVGRIKCWGYNNGGGFPSNAPPATELNFGTSSPVTDFVMGHVAFVCALHANGTVNCMGERAQAFTQASIGNLVDSPTTPPPNMDFGSGRHAVRIAGQIYAACAVLNDGNVSCRTAGFSGFTPLSSFGLELTPPPDDPAVDVLVGGHAICVTQASGTVRCVGTTTSQFANSTAWYGDNQHWTPSMTVVPFVYQALGGTRLEVLRLSAGGDGQATFKVYTSVTARACEASALADWTLQESSFDRDTGVLSYLVPNAATKAIYLCTEVTDDGASQFFAGAHPFRPFRQLAGSVAIATTGLVVHEGQDVPVALSLSDSTQAATVDLYVRPNSTAGCAAGFAGWTKVVSGEPAATTLRPISTVGLGAANYYVCAALSNGIDATRYLATNSYFTVVGRPTALDLSFDAGVYASGQVATVTYNLSGAERPATGAILEVWSIAAATAPSCSDPAHYADAGLTLAGTFNLGSVTFAWSLPTVTAELTLHACGIYRSGTTILATTAPISISVIAYEPPSLTLDAPLAAGTIVEFAVPYVVVFTASYLPGLSAHLTIGLSLSGSCDELYQTFDSYDLSSGELDVLPGPGAYTVCGNIDDLFGGTGWVSAPGLLTVTVPEPNISFDSPIDMNTGDQQTFSADILHFYLNDFDVLTFYVIDAAASCSEASVGSAVYSEQNGSTAMTWTPDTPGTYVICAEVTRSLPNSVLKFYEASSSFLVN